MSSETDHFAGVVLCGGESTRMGIDKARLPFGDETMLARVVRKLAQVVQPIVVVSAVAQQIPPLSIDVRHVHDRHPAQGPLEGLAAGMAAVAGEAQGVYVTSCDVPLLVPDFAGYMISRIDQYDAAVVQTDGLLHSLAAVYRMRALATLDELLAAGERRLQALLSRLETRIVAPEELASIDPLLGSLKNVNRPEDYFAALEAAGLTAPPAIRRLLDPSPGD